MAFERWKDRIRKVEIEDAEWEELEIPVTGGMPLGEAILKNFLQHDGDVIEVDLEGKDKRAVGNMLKALRKAVKGKNIDFLLRYSKDGKKAYIKRIG